MRKKTEQLWQNPIIRVDSLFEAARQIILSARAKAYAVVNTEMVSAYWQVGQLIVEEEQNGQERAGYGKAIIASLSQRLTEEFGKGYTQDNLWLMRQFYRTYPIPDALRRELTWTHYRLLIRVRNEQARQFTSPIQFATRRVAN
ncbi:MAG: DUF1016 N-terminal domain-containing protein [Bacteroidota bacterium]